MAGPTFLLPSLRLWPTRPLASSMQLPAGNLTALLQALQLTQGFLKPIPSLSSLDAGGNLPVGSSFSPSVLSPSLDQPAAAGEHAGQPLSLSHSSGSSGDGDRDVYAAGNQCNVQPYNPGPVQDQTFPPFDQSKANVYRYRRQQSVNLGSWCVDSESLECSLTEIISGSSTNSG